MNEQDQYVAQLIRECSGVYDVVAILETLAFLAPRGVTFGQVERALMALQLKVA